MLTFVVVTLSIRLSAQDHIVEIAKIIDQFKHAIATSDGAQASLLVDNHTLEYYGKILQLVRSADSVETVSLPLIEMIAVTFVRHKYTAEKVLSFDPETLMRDELQDGLFKRIPLQNLSIESVLVNDNAAQAKISDKSGSVPSYIYLNKDGDSWRIDATSIIALLDSAIQQSAQKQIFTNQAFVQLTLLKHTGRIPLSNIWHKVAR
jgi:hypothetical protein